MRTVVHLSDLHFDAVDAAVTEALVGVVRELAPDVVVVSGDLTQRARRRQFEAARRFLQTLPRPQIVVPGNHDVPLFNPFTRALDPLGPYRRYLSDDLTPFHADGELAVAGVNTAHALTVKGGAISSADATRVARLLAPLPEDVVKMVVSHHPLPLSGDRRLYGWAQARRAAILRLVDSGVDVFLTGHLHLSYAARTAIRYRLAGRSAIMVGAGTAISRRMRGETNAFNVLRVTPRRLAVERWRWEEARRTFGRSMVDHFDKGPEGWKAVND